MVRGDDVIYGAMSQVLLSSPRHSRSWSKKGQRLIVTRGRGAR